jgi:ribosomal-protein-serine acetyltransferase
VSSAKLAETLETPRLWLRWPEPGEAAVVLESMTHSWPELTQWLYWTRTGLPTLEQCAQRQSEARDANVQGKALHFSLFLKSSGAFIGKLSFFEIEWGVPKAGIGYWLDTRFVGQGYMTEAVTELTRYGVETLGLARIQIDCDPRNSASARIAQRCGYLHEGNLRNGSRDLAGELRDMAVYAMTPVFPRELPL